MYIVFESIAMNDPKWIPQLERFSNFWLYVVGKIDDTHASQLDLVGLKASVISEDVATGVLFAQAQYGKVTVKANTPNYDLVLQNESGKILDPKVHYELTTEDETKAVSFIKAVLKNYSQHHAPTADDKSLFDAEVDLCTTIDECNWILYNYLDTMSYNTVGPKTNKFTISWI